MSISESDLSSILSKGHCKVAGKVDSLQQVISAHGFKGTVPVKKEKPAGKPQGGNLRLILPFRLPTWNRLLAMNQWERAKIRHWIHERISECILSGESLQTQTGLVLRLQLTDSCLQEYSKMMAPHTSQKLASRKKKATLMKRS